MGIWVEILKLGACGEGQAAREKLASDLALSLRRFVPSSEELRRYQGPIPLAVRRFIADLPVSERALSRSRECDFVDYILDDVCAEVERTLLFVEFCHRQPEATLAELQSVFPWAPGLKRSDDWKRERTASYIKSFVTAGVKLPTSIINAVGYEGAHIFPFNEIAYAVSSKRLEQSWKDFKEQMEWSEDFVGITLGEDDISSSAEFIDYGSISSARLVDGLTPSVEMEIGLDLLLLGRKLSPELNGLMEDLHAANVVDGYRPIAWHSVFWNVSSEYDYLPLELEQRDPLRETDQELASHLAANYPDVKSTSRPVISRRRKGYTMFAMRGSSDA
ncbi:MAG: hypothetical protein L0220_01820 [Acidobacteria bacterium]|nr:hypothetical protein [Acidobacteriota bacterium]